MRDCFILSSSSIQTIMGICILQSGVCFPGYSLYGQFLVHFFRQNLWFSSTVLFFYSRIWKRKHCLHLALAFWICISANMKYLLLFACCRMDGLLQQSDEWITVVKPTGDRRNCVQHILCPIANPWYCNAVICQVLNVIWVYICWRSESKFICMHNINL